MGRVFTPFWSENGYTLSPFWSGIGYMVFGGTTGVYQCICRFNSKIMSKKEREICEFEMDWKKFCLRSNLSNDNIISA